MSDDLRNRQWATMRTCDRILSGNRPVSPRERLALLTAAADPDDMPDFYGSGGVVDRLETRVAGLLGTEAAVFFPTGTMAQVVALRHAAGENGTVALHPMSHLERRERHAYSQLAGLRAVWPTEEPRNATAAEIAALPDQVGAVVVELPLREAGFVLPTWEELVAVREVSDYLHFDGARLWESTVHLGHPLAEVAALADSVYVSFYKSLGGLSGAALAGSGALAEYARAWRHRQGGMIFQQWPAALAALDGLDHELPRLPDYVGHARLVAAALAEALPAARMRPGVPHTHQFHLWLPYPPDVLNEALFALTGRERTWFVGPWRESGVPGTALAECTVASPALDWTAADVAEAAARFLDLVGKAA